MSWMQMRMRLMAWATMLCLLFALSSGPVWAKSRAKSPDKQTPAASSQAAASKSPAKAVGSAPSEAEIAAAKASGKVWVNLDSGVYHKRGRWYGKTKNGKFMTEDEARKAGYRKAKRE